jgi:acyl-CoA synthetase (AMP-forming)/AMP-acid ligase II
MGYFNRPTDTAEVIDSEGWLYMGDLGHCDGDGHFYVVDRLKMIKAKGYQVGGHLQYSIWSVRAVTRYGATYGRVNSGGVTSRVSVLHVPILALTVSGGTSGTGGDPGQSP